MTKRSQPESASQQLVFTVLGLNESRYPALRWIHAIPNGGQRHSAVAAKLKAEGVKAGISDICLPFRSADGRYPGAYIEMKAGKNKLTAEQAEFFTFVSGQGYAIQACYSADVALEFIEAYIGGRLRGWK